MSKPVSLGRKLSDSISIHEIDPEKECYPDLYISDVDDPRIAEMPDSGTAVIKYKVVHRNRSEEINGKTKEHRCSVRLEIHSIELPVKSKKPKESDGGARKALDDYFREK